MCNMKKSFTEKYIKFVCKKEKLKKIINNNT